VGGLGGFGFGGGWRGGGAGVRRGRGLSFESMRRNLTADITQEA